MQLILVCETSAALNVVIVLSLFDFEMISEAISVGPQQTGFFVLDIFALLPPDAIQVIFDVVLHVAFAIEHLDLLACLVFAEH